MASDSELYNFLTRTLSCPPTRHAEIERDQAAGRARGEVAEPITSKVVHASIGGSAAAKRVQKMEREMRSEIDALNIVVKHYSTHAHCDFQLYLRLITGA